MDLTNELTLLEQGEVEDSIVALTLQAETFRKRAHVLRVLHFLRTVQEIIDLNEKKLKLPGPTLTVQVHGQTLMLSFSQNGQELIDDKLKLKEQWLTTRAHESPTRLLHLQKSQFVSLNWDGLLMSAEIKGMQGYSSSIVDFDPNQLLKKMLMPELYACLTHQKMHNDLALTARDGKKHKL